MFILIYKATQVKRHLKKLIEIGFSSNCAKDTLFPRFTCTTLQKLAKSPDFKRLSNQSSLLTSIFDLILNKDIPTHQWFLIAEEAINTIYALSEHPEHLAEKLIETIGNSTFSRNSDQNKPSEISPSAVSKFLFLLGHIAVKQLVHIEDIQKVIRQRREESSQNSKNSKKHTGKKKQTAIEQELGQDIENAAAETEIESLQKKAEREIIGSRGLIGSWANTVARICTNEGGVYDDRCLRNSAVLCLCKFMVVNQEFW